MSAIKCGRRLLVADGVVGIYGLSVVTLVLPVGNCICGVRWSMIPGSIHAS